MDDQFIKGAVTDIETEIKALRSHLLQDYMELVLCDDWKKILYDHLEDIMDKNLSYKNSYVNTYIDMVNIGVNNYSIKDMEVAVINNLIKFRAQWSPPIFKYNPSSETADEIRFLYVDRCIFAHKSDNEALEGLIHDCKRELYNEKTLINTIIANDRTIPKEERTAFTEKQKSIIEELNEKITDIESKYKNQLEINGCIRSILESDNQSEEWLDYYRMYSLRSQKIQQYTDLYKIFVIKSSDAGIIEAHIAAADIYFTEKEYDEMLNRLLLYIRATKNVDTERANAIISMINESRCFQQETNRKEELILNIIIEQGYKIEQTENGYVCSLPEDNSASKNKEANAQNPSNLNVTVSAEKPLKRNISDIKNTLALERELITINNEMKSELFSPVFVNTNPLDPFASATSAFMQVTSLMRYRKLKKRRDEIEEELKKENRENN